MATLVCGRRSRLAAALILAAVGVAPLLLGGCVGRQSAKSAANAGKTTDDLTTAEGQDVVLLRAAADGNVFRVRDLLDAGANIEAHASSGSTPRLGALYYRYPQTAELLISRGANINVRTTQGVTPLHQAAWSDLPQICRLLIARGADPNVRTPAGVTPLMWGAHRGYADVVQVLLEGGARPDIRAPDGATALSLAQDAGHTDVVRLLEAAPAASPAAARPAG